VLNGLGGADSMNGGLGNDIYRVDTTADKVTEKLNSGIDIVNSAVNYALPANVENLTLIGSEAKNAKGNGLANVLNGNSLANVLNGLGGDDILKAGLGNDLLIGGAGKDLLTGGLGSDIFRFNSLVGTDSITDFSTVADTLELSKSVFKAFAATGQIPAGAFRSGAGVTKAADANDHLIYNTTTGDLFYDANGNAAGGAVKIAVLGTTSHPTLTAADFTIVS
jgi:Ca2+-binding RTX toxin-like protein